MNTETAAKITTSYEAVTKNLQMTKETFAADLLGEGFWGSEHYARGLENVAEAIGTVKAWALAAQVVEWAARTPEEVPDVAGQISEYLMEELLRGADDSWSGRTNDARRSEADGFRKASERILRVAKSGSYVG